MWLSASRTISQLFTWAIVIIVARILSPEDYGLMGMAGLLIGFMALFNEMGLGAAIIQREEIQKQELNTIFWFSLFFGLLLYGAAWVAAPAIAWFFKTEELILLIRILSLSLLIGPFRIVPFNLLTRDLVFDKRSKIELAANLVAGLTSLSIALGGAGVWSLVGATLAREIVLVVALWFLVEWKPSLSIGRGVLLPLLSFGGKVSGERLMWYGYANSDYLIIGRLLGDRLLGYYSMAFQLASKPIDKVAEISNSISFPLFSRLKDQPQELRQSFLRITEIIALLLFPALIGLCCVADELVEVLLTEKWAPMVFPFQILCLVGLFKSVLSVIPNLLLAKGKPGLLIRYTVTCLIVMPAAFFIGCMYGGLAGVVVAWAIAYPLLFVIILRYGLRESGATLGEYLRAIQTPLVASLIIAASVLGLKFVLHPEISRIRLLVLECGLGAIVYLVYVYCKSEWVRDRFREAVRSLNGLFASAKSPKIDTEEKVSR